MKNPKSARPALAVVAAAIAVLFGALTLYSGGSVLFVDGQARTDAGAYVPFVLWFNFLAGFAYIAAGVGLYLWRGWAVGLSAFIAIATLLVFSAFGLHILLGGGFETRTIGAMSLRGGVWATIALYACAAWKMG